MHEEDMKNLVGWLQAIFKESQNSRAAANDVRRHAELLPELRDMLRRDERIEANYEHKLEDTKNHLENQMRKIEDLLNELRHEIRDIKSKVDHLK